MSCAKRAVIHFYDSFTPKIDLEVIILVLCKLCNKNEALPEGSLCQPCRDSNERKKINLVLVDSDLANCFFGVVKDCHSCANYIPEDAEVVGTWGKYDEHTYWVSIMTPIEALQDKLTIYAIQTSEASAKVLREAEKNRETPKVHLPSKPRVPTQPTPPARDVFADLKALLKH